MNHTNSQIPSNQMTYTTLLKDKFPVDERLGLYKSPALPAKKLGKILTTETRITSPNDVIGLHISEGFFSTTYLIFTGSACYYPGGTFLLEDWRELQVNDTKCTALVNQKGGLTQHLFSVGSGEVGILLKKVVQNIHAFQIENTKINESQSTDYSRFEGLALDWLLLRDEVMRTIDMLYEKFNEGKLSLLEYEEKKQQLLDRL